MKLCLCGHSLCHVRQLFFAESLSKLGNEVLVLAPENWNHLTLSPISKENFKVVPLEATTNSIYDFQLIGLHDEIKAFSPDLVYALEEPTTSFARQVMGGLDKSIKLGFHSYENINKLDGKLIEITIKYSDFLIAGNRGAYDILSEVKKPDLILPLTGINTELFKPETTFETHVTHQDIIYHGRNVIEKGVEYIRRVPNTTKNLVFLPTVAYDTIPYWINNSKISIQYPYSTPTWKEQFNCAIAESLACNVPVIASDEDAIVEYYSDCPDCHIIEGKNQEALNKEVELMLFAETPFTYPIRCGRDFVLDKLSNEVIARKLNKLFEEVVK